MSTNKYTVGELSTLLAPPILTFLLIFLKIKHLKCNQKKGYLILEIHYSNSSSYFSKKCIHLLLSICCFLYRMIYYEN